MNNFSRIVDFFFEAGILQHMKRSGNIFLGSGDQTVASHVFRVAIIGYVMSKILELDSYKVLLICLFHDIEESRTGDLNYLQQVYVKSDDEKALYDLLKGLPIESEVSSFLKEYAKLESLEAKVAKDADTIELILYLKEQLDKGNTQAHNWIDAAKKRLITSLAKDIVVAIENGRYYEWWYNLKNDWENGSKQW